MHFTENNRSSWKFSYSCIELAEAAKTKMDYRQSRVDWWSDQQAKIMEEIKDSGLTINESIALQYLSSGSISPRLIIKPELQTKLTECYDKVKEHKDAFDEYSGWLQILLDNEENRMDLNYNDWMFFFSKN